MDNRDYRTLTLNALYTIKRRIESTKNPSESELEEYRRIESELARRLLFDD